MAEERVQRKLTTILAADVEGYSRLMSADEETTLKTLKTYREIIDGLIARHDGRIFGTAGDSVVAEFGSAVEAVRCAMSIQEDLAVRNAELAEDRRMRFRIGINVGDVMVEGDDLFGDGVNVAARLEGLAEPGGICISGSTFDQVKNKLSVGFEDIGLQEVKNIPEPVPTYRLVAGSVSVAPSPQAPAAAAGQPEAALLELPDKPSIAVLPFENMSGDPEQEFFADGMTEDIITELSRFEDLFVIARNTSFTYKGQPVDAKVVAQELGVHFILEGSVRKMGQRVRITAQLINGQDGGHVWAERYNGALENVFALQEQVTSQVVGSISPHVTQAELERIGRDERFFDEAHELAWLAQETSRSALRLREPPMLDRAIAMAIEAVEMNAKCGIAYQTICFGYALQSLYRWGENPSASAGYAEDWAKKFLSQLPNSYMAYHSLGLARLRKGQYQDANRDFQHAHELNPNDSVVLRFWSWCEASAGEFESAKAHAHLAIRLSPKDTFVHPEYLALAMAAFIEKDAAGFEEWAGKAIRLAPYAPTRRAMMIAYAAEAGNQSLLETHRAELMRSAPDFIDSLFRGENQLFQKPEHMAMLLDGLRKAGFPE